MNQDDLNHEIAHGLYYLNKKYKKEMDSLINPRTNFYKNFKIELQLMEYSDDVIKDEIQAYCSTQSFENTPNKIHKLENQSTENQNELIEKEFTLSPVSKVEYSSSTPKILYDSGWVGYKTYEAGSTAEKNQLAPLYAQFFINQNIRIPKSHLPYAKLSIMVKKHPDMNLEGVYAYHPSVYEGRSYSTGDAYQEVHGDSTVIYKGRNIAQKFKTQEQKNNYEFLESYTTRWWQGRNDDGTYDFQWVASGTPYRWHNATLERMYAIYDKGPVLSPAGYRNYKYFETKSFTGISSSAIQGYGHRQSVVWTYVGPTAWDWVSNTTHSFGQFTASPLDDATFFGSGGTIEYFSGGEWITLTRWGPYYAVSSTYTITDFNFYRSEYFKLHYTTDKFGYEIDTDGNGLLNLPNSEDYKYPSAWSGQEPYSIISHKVNPAGYPEKQTGDMEEQVPNSYMCWTKTPDYFGYKLNVAGKVVLSAPATEQGALVADEWDDDYVPDTYTYDLPVEDRTEKDVDWYNAVEQDIEIKVVLTITPPLDIAESKTLSIKES